MPAVVFPRRIRSTPVSVTVSGLPAWLPSPGTWASVSLNSTTDITTANGPFTAGRSLDFLFSDYSGAVWNPYIGTYGAWVFMGGGHSTGIIRLDNGVYAWNANTRMWQQIGATTYPGEIGTAYWPPAANASYDGNGHYPEPFTTYNELSVGIPASYHSRWTLDILPPAFGGGPQGSLISTQMAATHIGGNTGSKTAHGLNCATGVWSRIGPRNEQSTSDGGSAWVGCVDTTRGRVLQLSNQGMYWINPQNPTGWTRCNPSGWSSIQNSPTVYIPEYDCFAHFNGTWDLRIKSATDLYASAGTYPISPVTGTKPLGQAHGGQGMTWCPHLGPHGALVSLDYQDGYKVKACYAPSNPLAGTWSWAVLSASNAPTFSWTAYDNQQVGFAMYSKFQYAPALKSFFVCVASNGQMWCFRPTGIA